ncbi:MAG: hypothetical protein EP297_03515 [Gammaproteobacteria bacterium]|nr:MAG: hypothetical protein EP297_03515 [Gammaproteobacteria bacterium]
MVAEEARENSNNFIALQFHGVVEVEAILEDDHAGIDGNDVTLATVELGFHSSVSNDWVTVSFVA